MFYELDEDDEWVPQPASAGIRPPTNCMFLDDAGNLKFKEDGTVDTSKRDEKIEKLLSKRGLTETYEKHHIVTEYANADDPVKQALVEQMVEILGEYGLTVRGDFNKVVIPHQGPHPAAYHQWVLQNLEKVNRAADGDVGAFLEMFDTWITQQIQLDPSIVLKDYWECHV